MSDDDQREPTEWKCDVGEALEDSGRDRLVVEVTEVHRDRAEEPDGDQPGGMQRHPARVHPGQGPQAHARSGFVGEPEVARLVQSPEQRARADHDRNRGHERDSDRHAAGSSTVAPAPTMSR